VNPIRRLRAERRMTVRELAQASGVNKNTISDLEHGLRRARPVTLGKLADALGVPVWALEETPVPPPPKTPLTVMPEAEFDERFASATDPEGAETLADAVGKEYDALGEHLAALDGLGIGNDDLRRRSARSRRRASKRRTYAATLRAANMGLNADFGRDLAIHNTVAAYVGEAEAVAEYVAEEARTTHRDAG